jgi:selenocysteine-specific elongation factor
VKRVIIGTAGHIDHGKTALVKAMTGVDTDRLKEEKKRGISIKLGFAPLMLPNGQLAGIVDVPGHERFIRQMLAGAFGVDLVLLVIAADEGIMPQTKEHIDIVRFLGITHGIVVLTKKDLVDDDWLMLVEEDVSDYLRATELKDWPMVAVSAYDPASVRELLKVIEKSAAEVEEKPATGKVRLPIDRVFSMTGFGTVVTGTLWSGVIRPGDALAILPTGLAVKVRTLQVHNQKVEEALAGQRVAVNLPGIEVSEVRRGDVLSTPGWLQPSYRVDATLRLLESSPWPLKNWARIRFHLGTDETLGRVILLDRDELKAGEQGYVQIAMEKPVVCVKNDRYVIRFYSPVTTIGGGTIIDAHPPKQKRFNEEVLQALAVQEEGSLAERVLQVLEKSPGQIYQLEDLMALTEADDLSAAMRELKEREQVNEIQIDKKKFFISRIGLENSAHNIVGLLQNYKSKYPLRRGYPKEALRTGYFKDYPVKVFNALIGLLEQEGIVTSTAAQVQLVENEPLVTDQNRKAIDQVITLLEKNPLSPPGFKELQEIILSLGQDPVEIMMFLEEEGLMVKIAEGMYLTPNALNAARERLYLYFLEHSELSLGAARDLWGTSRKIALPLLEYFDRARITRRKGDVRIKIGG